jgi:hypothetical protein
VILEHANRTFGGINAMIDWLDELIGGSTVEDSLLNGGRGLVVHDVQAWLVSVSFEDIVEFCVGTECFNVATVFHGFTKDGIGIVVV